MEYVESIINAFGVPAVMVSLLAFLAFYIPRVEARLKAGDKKFEMLEKNIMTIGKTALRLEIVNENIPLLERAKAYEIYVNDFKGNGAIKQYYEEKIEPYLTDLFDEHH